MVNWEDIWSSVPGLGIFLILPLMMYSMIALAPFGAVGVVVGMVASEGALVAFMRISRFVIVFYAMKVSHVKCRPTATKPPYGWKWRGMFIYRFKDPPAFAGYLPHYRFQNGHMGGFVYKLKVDWVKNPIKHPFYNRGGLLRNMFWVMEFRWPVQMEEEEDTVAYHKTTVPNIKTVSWANLHEIMPTMEYFRDPKAWNRLAGKHNHVPFVEPDDLSHTPWFEVTDSSGMRAARESQMSKATQRRRVEVAMMAGPKATEVLLCPDCKEQLTIDGETATCKNGHRWNDLR